MCYYIEIENVDGEKVSVKVSEEVYEVFQEEKLQKERYRYEKRKHIDGRALDHYVVVQKMIAENLEEYCINREKLQKIYEIIKSCTPTQQRRFYLNRICGYSYTEIAEMEHCQLYAVQKSVYIVLKKIQQNIL